MRLVERAYATLGITDYSYRLSLRRPANTEKYVQNDAMWELGERVLREAMQELGLPFYEAPDEAAFYGPKIDIQIRDVLGREETMSTIQVDFHLPNQFELDYIGEDGAQHRPVIIHRGVIGATERMMAYLIELYAGAFPTWLAPVQAMVIPIADRHADYAHEVLSAAARGRLPRRSRRPQRADELEDPRRAAAEDPVHARRRRPRGGGAGRLRAHARRRRPEVDARVPVHRPPAGRDRNSRWIRRRRGRIWAGRASEAGGRRRRDDVVYGIQRDRLATISA